MPRERLRGVKVGGGTRSGEGREGQVWETTLIRKNWKALLFHANIYISSLDTGSLWKNGF